MIANNYYLFHPVHILNACFTNLEVIHILHDEFLLQSLKKAGPHLHGYVLPAKN